MSFGSCILLFKRKTSEDVIVDNYLGGVISGEIVIIKADHTDGFRTESHKLLCANDEVAVIETLETV